MQLSLLCSPDENELTSYHVENTVGIKKTALWTNYDVALEKSKVSTNQSTKETEKRWPSGKYPLKFSEKHLSETRKWKKISLIKFKLKYLYFNKPWKKFLVNKHLWKAVSASIQPEITKTLTNSLNKKRDLQSSSSKHIYQNNSIAKRNQLLHQIEFFSKQLSYQIHQQWYFNKLWAKNTTA